MKIKSFIFLCILVIYTSIYLMINMGYYEYANYKKKELTEGILEQQIKNGSLGSYKEKELSRQTILKSSLFQWR